MKRIRTELKKNHKGLYYVLKQEKLLDWFEKLVRCNGSIEGALEKIGTVIKYQHSKGKLVDRKTFFTLVEQ